jgi:hypothetical protein
MINLILYAVLHFEIYQVKFCPFLYREVLTEQYKLIIFRRQIFNNLLIIEGRNIDSWLLFIFINYKIYF